MDVEELFPPPNPAPINDIQDFLEDEYVEGVDPGRCHGNKKKDYVPPFLRRSFVPAAEVPLEMKQPDNVDLVSRATRTIPVRRQRRQNPPAPVERKRRSTAASRIRVSSDADTDPAWSDDVKEVVRNQRSREGKEELPREQRMPQNPRKRPRSSNVQLRALQERSDSD